MSCPQLFLFVGLNLGAGVFFFHLTQWLMLPGILKQDPKISTIGILEGQMLGLHSLAESIVGRYLI